MCVEQFQYCQGCESLLYQRFDRCSIPGSHVCRNLRYRIHPEKRICEACRSVDSYFHSSRLDHYRAKASTQGCRSVVESIDWTVITQGNDMFLVPTTRFSFAELEGVAGRYFRSKATADRKVTEYKAMAVSQTKKFKYRYLTKVRPLRRKFGLGQKITVTPVPMPESESKAW